MEKNDLCQKGECATSLPHHSTIDSVREAIFKKVTGDGMVDTKSNYLNNLLQQFR